MCLLCDVHRKWLRLRQMNGEEFSIPQQQKEQQQQQIRQRRPSRRVVSGRKFSHESVARQQLNSSKA